MKPKTKTLVFLLISFILGVGAGIVMYRSNIVNFGARGGRMSTGDFRQLFHSRLELQPEQMSAVDSLLDAYRIRMNVHREAILQVRDSLRVEIRKVLTDRQQMLYEEFLRDMNTREGRSDSTRSKRY